MRLGKIGYSSATSLLSQVATGVSVFVISPVIIGSLGVEPYGIWLLAVSLCAYLSHLDLGVEGTALRFLSATEDSREPGKRAALYAAFRRFYTGTSGLVAVVGIAALGVTLLLDPAGKYHSLVLACGVLSLSTSIVFFCRPRVALLRSSLRHDIVALIATCRVTGFTVCVLIFAESLAFWNFMLIHTGSVLAEQAALFVAAQRFLPRQPSVPPIPVDLRAVRSHAFTNVISNVARAVVNSADYQIIAAFVSVAAVTQYGVGMRLPTIFGDIITALFGSQFIAWFGQLQATGDRHQQLGALRMSQQVSVAVCLALAVPIFCLSPFFITRWLGDGFAEAIAVTQLLIIPLALSLSTSPIYCFLVAASGHRRHVYWVLAGGLLNFIASLLLVKPLGVIGVIIPTAVQMSLNPLLLAWISRPHTDWDTWEFTRTILLRPLALLVGLCAPFCWLITHWIQPDTYGKMAIAAGLMGFILLPVAALGVLDRTTRARLTASWGRNVGAPAQAAS